MRHGGDERLRVGMLRRLHHVAAGAHLDHPAEVHHGNPLAKVGDHADVVGDQNEGLPRLLLERLHQVEDLRLDRHVERGDRLVGNDQLRVERECARDPDSLPLPAAQLVREAVEEGFGQPCPRDQRLEAVPGMRQFVRDEWLGNDLPNAQPWVERRFRVLKDHLHVAPERPQLVLAHPRDVDAAEPHAARGRLVEAEDGAGKRRLAAPALAHQPERLTPLDCEGDAVDRLEELLLAAPRPLLADRKVLLDVRYLKERAHPGGASVAASEPRSRPRVVGPSTATGLGSESTSAKWQAAR